MNTAPRDEFGAASALVGELMPESHADLMRFLALRVHDRGIIEDLAQEAYLRILELRRVHQIRNPRAYLFRVAASVIADRFRQGGRSIRVDPCAPPTAQLADDSNGPFEQCLWRQRFERVQAVVFDLPERCRRALILHRRDGWTYDEIAVELGVSRSMVKKYLRKALLLCRQAME